MPPHRAPGARCSRARSRSASALPRAGTTSAGAPPAPVAEQQSTIAAGASVPPCQVTSTAGARSIQSATTSGRPFASTTTNGMPVPAIARIRSLLLARAGAGRCASSPRPRATTARRRTTTTTSLSSAAVAAASMSSGVRPKNDTPSRPSTSRPAARTERVRERARSAPRTPASRRPGGRCWWRRARSAARAGAGEAAACRRCLQQHGAALGRGRAGLRTGLARSARRLGRLVDVGPSNRPSASFSPSTRATASSRRAGSTPGSISGIQPSRRGRPAHLDVQSRAYSDAHGVVDRLGDTVRQQFATPSASPTTTPSKPHSVLSTSVSRRAVHVHRRAGRPC